MPPLTSHMMPDAAPGARIGLLGGSFNPAHEGHLHISQHAIELLALDQVWWLVSPQNPLKSADGMAPLSDRLNGAVVVAGDRAITVTDLEREFGTQYTVDTLKILKERFEGVHFVWLMGADLLLQIEHWSRWEQLFETVPIAVFARPPYSENAENAKASRHFAEFRLESNRAEELVEQSPPAWVFLKTPENPVSATEIRAGLS